MLNEAMVTLEASFFVGSKQLKRFKLNHTQEVTSNNVLFTRKLEDQ